MARHTGGFNGKIGPVILYTMNGKQYSRSWPRKVKQTDSTKKRSANFAIASTFSKLLRNYMTDICKVKDGTRHNRLTSMICKWLKTTSIETMPSGEILLLKDFPLNKGKMNCVGWKEHIFFIENAHTLQIKINEFTPKQMMAVPKGTLEFRLTIMYAVLPLNGMASRAIRHIIFIPYEKPFLSTDFVNDISSIPGSLVVGGFSVECLDDQRNIIKWRKGYDAPAEIQVACWNGFASA